MKNRKLLLIAVLLVSSAILFAGVPRQFDKEIMPVKKVSKTAQSMSKTVVGTTELLPMGTPDTLKWCDETANTNFGGWTGDYFAEYFVPATDGDLLSFTFNMSDLPEVTGGGMNIWIYTSQMNWSEISTPDIADGIPDAWLGYYDTDAGVAAMGTESEWHAGGVNDVEGAIAGKIYDPLGTQVWPGIGSAYAPMEPNEADGGFVTVNLAEADPLGSTYHFEMGDTFLVVIQFAGFPDDGDDANMRLGFLSQTVVVDPQPGLKFYHPQSNPNGRSTDPEINDWGWYIRTYAWDWRCNVDYTGDRAPKIEDVDVLYTTVSQGTRTVTATITDDNPGGGAAGIASAQLVYSVDGGAEVAVDMTASGDVYSADIPGQSPGAEVTYYVTATDVADLVSTSLPNTYGIYLPTAGEDLLVVWNNNDYPWAYDLGGYTIVDLYLYPASFSGLTYDIWDAWNWGPVSKELLDNYKVVVDVGMGGPAWAGAAYGGDDIAAWLAEGTAETQHAYALFAQDYGTISGFNDTTFPAGAFEYDYLGVETLGPQDYNYDGTVTTYEKPFKVTATTDAYVADLAAFEGDSLAMYYYPLWEIGYNNWIDIMVPNSNGIAMVEDVDGNVNGVRVEGTNFQTMYWALDLLCLDFWNPAYADTLSSDNGDSGAEGAMYYWAVTDVTNPLANWIAAIPDGIEDGEVEVAQRYSLKQNYPNPFNPTTSIAYTIENNDMVSLTVYNMLGQQVRTLVNDRQTANSYQVTWDGKDNAGMSVPSGIYFYTLKSGSFVSTKKMVLMK